MFKEDQIVFFKNPVNFGRIIRDTEIGPRWCIDNGAVLNETAPIAAATAGILKLKFRVTGGVEDKFVVVTSVDKQDSSFCVDPRFLTEGASQSILNSQERRMLFYLNDIVESAYQEMYEEDATESVEEAEARKKCSAEDCLRDIGNVFFEKQPEAEHNCSNCGKCSNKNRSLEDKAARWEKMFSDARKDKIKEENNGQGDSEFERQFTEAVAERLAQMFIDRMMRERAENKRRFVMPIPDARGRLDMFGDLPINLTKFPFFG